MGPDRPADIAAEGDQAHVDGVAQWRRDDCLKFLMALIGASSDRPAEATRYPVNMCIDWQDLSVEREKQDAASDLVRHAWKRDQIRESLRIRPLCEWG